MHLLSAECHRLWLGRGANCHHQGVSQTPHSQGTGLDLSENWVQNLRVFLGLHRGVGGWWFWMRGCLWCHFCSAFSFRLGLACASTFDPRLNWTESKATVQKLAVLDPKCLFQMRTNSRPGQNRIRVPAGWFPSCLAALSLSLSVF